MERLTDTARNCGKSRTELKSHCATKEPLWEEDGMGPGSEGTEFSLGK